METKITPVILSGGAGTRLWPMSRTQSPKQLLKLTGATTMLQMTVARTADPTRFHPPMIIAHDVHAAEIERQLASAGFQTKKLVLEPAARNTAAAITLAAVLASPDELLLVMPSDHVIADTGAFQDAVQRAVPVAQSGWLVTFGVRPTRAETGYGYIHRGDHLSPGVHRVQSFVEKPAAEIATQLAADGQHVWNAGIFMFRAEAFLSAMEKHAPDVLQAVRTSVRNGTAGEGRFRPEPSSFQTAPSISVDHAILEKAERVAVVPVSMEWSDVGSWDALYEALEKDAYGSGTAGDVVAIGCNGSLIQSSGPLVAAIGVEDLIIVATEDAVLVMPRGESQRVREAVEACREQGREDLL
ncbi:MAG: mannose-1-phosphate guanylyltransferase/mannose-6-phosphate isomerase [Pseudomonadota bacterium]|nr:mannose-1-phosphate guanylyltransferase/mannose-6-phosphate isomerase [Pseudomonadota bacterium]